MKKIYNPKEIEKKLYKFWEKNKFFKYKKNVFKKNFCIIMPPPNITGNLHMGHAFQHTIMDILIRYNKMNGKNTLWQPGIDHAGIATQILVEKYINSKMGLSKNNITKENFLNIMWKWKKKMSNNICSQIRRLGSSVDWSRNYFTLDKKISKSVRFAFISLFNKKLIYRKKTLVNWDFKCQSVISDIEIENKFYKGFMWHIKYYFFNKNNLNNKKYIVVATTRPETILGDVAIAVNPNDSRYKLFIGKRVVVPIVNRIIPIVSDINIKINKGTGCVKITPAHDFNDYKIAISNKLPLINIFTKDGKIYKKLKIYINKHKYEELSPKFLHDLDKIKARKKILDFLKKNNLLNGIEKIKIKIPIGDRTGSIIEPRITNQWYLKVKKISIKALNLVQNDKIIFIPDKYKKLYSSWMNNLNDWCISRQLWWGHRIPVWYDNSNKIYVGNNENEVRKKYFLSKSFFLKKESDVLDTWFSSAIWSFSSLGWPHKNNILKMFHPTNVLVSGFDIIFFWIARMIMLTSELLEGNKNFPIQIPFKKVYITGLIRDEIGNKMSKSKGNVIDPIDIIDGITLQKLLKKRTSNMFKENIKHKIIYRTKKSFPNGINSYGTDALRFTLASLSSPTKNINWDMNRLKGYRSFCNKIWNIGVFIFLNVSKKEIEKIKSFKIIGIVNKWIFSKYNIMIKEYNICINNFRFDKASNILYNFIWNDFCNWYLEFLKVLFKHLSKKELCFYKYNLVKIFEHLLILSHPIIPFITESIWQKINIFLKKNSISILLQRFPKYKKKFINSEKLKDMDILQKFLVKFRYIRNKFKIKFSKKISVALKINNKILKKIYTSNLNFLKNVANLKDIIIVNKTNKFKKFIIEFLDEIEIVLFIKKDNKNFLCIKELIYKINKINYEINKLKNKLFNKNFIKRAPKNIIIFENKKIFFLKKSKENIIKKIKNI
ncbi:valine--tRNA ligase [Buchnera aphidicola (Ceratoglyphina bambusae)]|uniref:valine--tRNA ligase n=1 Tax=Buchnera aphidicola TaxID=9 RepID=UPI0031B86CD3